MNAAMSRGIYKEHGRFTSDSIYTQWERIANNLQFRRRHICLRLWNFSFISSHSPRLSDFSSRPLPFLLLVLFRLPMSPAEPASRVLGSLWFWDKVGRIWHEKNVV